MGFVGEFKRIRSLRDPDSKMSKSAIDPLSRINLLDSPDQIREKLRKSIADSIPRLSYEPLTRPAIANLLELHVAVINARTIDSTIARECKAIAGSQADADILMMGGADAKVIKVRKAMTGNQTDSYIADGTDVVVAKPQDLCEKHAKLDTLAYKMLLADELIEFYGP